MAEKNGIEGEKEENSIDSLEYSHLFFFSFSNNSLITGWNEEMVTTWHEYQEQ